MALFFLSNPVPFDWQSYQKQKEPGTSNHMLFRLWNKFRNIPLLVIYYPTEFDIKWFLSYPKNYICKFMQASPQHHKLFHFYLSFESGNCGKEGKKLQNFKFLENKKSFFDAIKNIFYNFWKTIIRWKSKILKKIAGTSFKLANENIFFDSKLKHEDIFLMSFV